jgi:polyisoprenoid-binding protein YceI
MVITARIAFQSAALTFSRAPHSGAIRSESSNSGKHVVHRVQNLIMKSPTELTGADLSEECTPDLHWIIIAPWPQIRFLRAMELSQSFLALALLSGACAAPAALAVPEEFVIDPNHTYATFEVRHLGISTQRGRFNRSTGKATLDAEAGSGSLDITIDAQTIDTGNDAMEKLLRGQDFFNVTKFPEIVFHSTMVTFTDGKPSRIEGDLTLLGVTRPVVLEVTHYACTRLPFLIRVRCGLDATTEIRRSEFGMTSLSSLVGDEVRLLIQGEAIKQEKPQQPQDGSSSG